MLRTNGLSVPGGAVRRPAVRLREGGHVSAPALFALRDGDGLGSTTVALVQVEGRFDSPACDALFATVDRLCRAQVPRMVLDLSRVWAMSSSAAAACLLAIGTARSRDGDLIILRPTPAVRDVLDVLGLTVLLPVASDLVSAIAAIGTPPGPRPDPSGGRPA